MNNEPQLPIRVMLVDDHQTMLWGLTALINSAAPLMEVVGTAANCDDALSTAKAVEPDVILLDLNLNGISALTILPLLVAMGPRVLILTGEQQRAPLDRAMLSGARGVLCKGVAAELVIKAVKKAHEGELWLDQASMGRVFGKLTGAAATEANNPDRGKIASLTRRERQIIDAVVVHSGASNKLLAQQLFVSEYTLRNHLTSIYRKLELTNRLALYVYAQQHRLARDADTASA